MRSLLESSTGLPVVFWTLAGLYVGNLLVPWIVRLADDEPRSVPFACPRCGFWYPRIRRIPIVGWLLMRGRCRVCGTPMGRWIPVVELGTGLLFGLCVLSILALDAHRIESPVVPAASAPERIVFYLALIALLVAATGTDLRGYVVPDPITVPGMLFAASMSTMFGSLQLARIWMEWSAPPGLYYLRRAVPPEWIVAHPHWHGFASAVAGFAVGGGAVWLIRIVSRVLLGRESLGFGDVTLMAMIGGFVGWQAAIIIVTLAPLTGLIAAATLRITSQRIILPYGPWLCLATLIVVGGWRWIWMFELRTGPRDTFMLREFFGDWVLLAIIGTLAFVALIVLLGLLRLYKALPVARSGRGGSG